MAKKIDGYRIEIGTYNPAYDYLGIGPRTVTLRIVKQKASESWTPTDLWVVYLGTETGISNGWANYRFKTGKAAKAFVDNWREWLPKHDKAAIESGRLVLWGA